MCCKCEICCCYFLHVQYVKIVLDMFLGLERDEHPEPGRLGIFDGEMLFETSNYLPITLAKMVWRYGMDVYNIRNWVQEKVIKCISR